MQGPIWNCQVIYNLDYKSCKIDKSSRTNISQKKKIKVKAEEPDRTREGRWVRMNSIYPEQTSLGECMIKLPRACENATTPYLQRYMDLHADKVSIIKTRHLTLGEGNQNGETERLWHDNVCLI